MFRTITTFAVAAGLAVAAAGVHAQSVTEVRIGLHDYVTSKVRFGDLDLATKSGSQRLAFRIRTAAIAVCGGDSQIERMSSSFPSCVHSAVDRAALELNVASVSAALDRGPA